MRRLVRYADIIVLLLFSTLIVVFLYIERHWVFYMSQPARGALFAVGGALVALYVALRCFPFAQTKIVLAKKWSSYILVAILCIVPGIIVAQQVAARATTHPFFLHDGALLDEAAIDGLLVGKNPYSMTYEQTFPEGNWRMVRAGDIRVLNPAIEHYIYLPATFLIDGLVGKAEQAVFGFRDSRILFFLCYTGALAFLWRVARSHPLRNALVIAFGLNPLQIGFLAEGRNDLLLFALLCATFALLANKRFALAGLCFGFACATKQFAWLFIPAIMAFLVVRAIVNKEIHQVVRFTLIAGIVASAIILPFVIWNSDAFIDDIISYPGGTSVTLNYPISGLGASRLLVLAGYPPMAAFPFWIPIGIVGLFVGWLGIRAVSKNPTLPIVVLVSTLLILATTLVSRVMQDSYLLFCADCLFIVFALFAYEKEQLARHADLAYHI